MFIQGPDVKNVDEAKPRTKGKQPVEPELIPIPHQQLHESLRVRTLQSFSPYL